MSSIDGPPFPAIKRDMVDSAIPSVLLIRYRLTPLASTAWRIWSLSFTRCFRMHTSYLILRSKASIVARWNPGLPHCVQDVRQRFGTFAGQVAIVLHDRRAFVPKEMPVGGQLVGSNAAFEAGDCEGLQHQRLLGQQPARNGFGAARAANHEPVASRLNIQPRGAGLAQQGHAVHSTISSESDWAGGASSTSSPSSPPLFGMGLEGDGKPA